MARENFIANQIAKKSAPIVIEYPERAPKYLHRHHALPCSHSRQPVKSALLSRKSERIPRRLSKRKRRTCLYEAAGNFNLTLDVSKDCVIILL